MNNNNKRRYNISYRLPKYLHFQLAPTRNQYSLRTGITRGTILQCLPLKILALQILMLRLNHLYRSTRQYYQTVSQINRVYLRTETSDSILVIQYLETDNHSSFTDLAVSSQAGVPVGKQRTVPAIRLKHRGGWTHGEAPKNVRRASREAEQ